LRDACRFSRRLNHVAADRLVINALFRECDALSWENPDNSGDRGRGGSDDGGDGVPDMWD
jgi:hypothetical protein